MARCLHGMDERFCSPCIRTRSGVSSHTAARTRPAAGRRRSGGADVPTMSQWIGYVQSLPAASSSMCILCRMIVPWLDTVQPRVTYSAHRIVSALEMKLVRVGCRVKMYEEVIDSDGNMELRSKVVPMTTRGIACLTCQDDQDAAENAAIADYQADYAAFNRTMSEADVDIKQRLQRMGIATPTRRAAYIDVSEQVAAFPRAARPDAQQEAR